MRSVSTAKKFVLHRQTDRVGQELRRSSRHRHRERAAAQRTASAHTDGDLTEALEQQTATSEVLQVISSSPGDLEPVFATMLENAVRICDATSATSIRWDGDALRIVATHNTPPAFAEARRRAPYSILVRNPVGRMMTTKTVVHIADLQRRRPILNARSGSRRSRRTWRHSDASDVPMLKENELIGALHLTAKKFVRSPISRSSLSRTSPPKPSSPSRTRGCSTNCGNAAGAADGHVGGASGHQ